MTDIVKSNTPGEQFINGRTIITAEILTKDWEVWALGSCNRKTSPESIWLCRPVGLIIGSPRGPGVIENSLLKGTHKISYTPEPRAEAVIWQETGSDVLLILENLPGRQETTSAHPGDIDTASSHFWKLLLPHGHWFWHVPLWNLPSSLLHQDPALPWLALCRHQC